MAMYRLRQLATRIVERVAKALQWRRLSWRIGAASERRFWQRYLSSGGLGWKNEFQRRLDPNAPLDDYLRDLLLRAFPDAATYEVLDVGAGPITSLGKTIEGKTIHLTATDPLANEYDQLLKDSNINPPIRTVHCRGEDLSKMFPPQKFHLTHARNCLDHSEDPIQAINEMVTVTREGGFAFLEHWVDEGEAEEYRGLHQWNFRCEEGDLIIWNQQSRTSLSHALNGKASIECFNQTQEGKPQVVAVIRRSTCLHCPPH